MAELKISPDRLLSLEDFHKIEATNLPIVDRYYLRLLAYSLASFKDMVNASSDGSLPLEQYRSQWLMSQPNIANEKDFCAALLEQFDVAAQQLEYLSTCKQISPLALTLQDLIDSRLSCNRTSSV